MYPYLSHFYETLQHQLNPLAGKIESGLPKVSLPPFSSQVGNQTYTFFDMCAHYGLGLGILPVISVLANVAIAKAFGIDFHNCFNNSIQSDSKLLTMKKN